MTAASNALLNTTTKDKQRQAETIKPYIVGIGASAGGLEALEEFFTHMPLTGLLSFVVVQHMDPNHKAMLAELLQRITKMSVVQASNHVKVMPDFIYVIPPNKDMTILHNKLILLPPEAPRGHRHPIDFFFRSLAEDQQERSVGIILSGMGSDGTTGFKAIKEKAGLTLVQSPESAKFASMPRSVIDAGLADIISPAKDLPGQLIDYLKHLPTSSYSENDSLTHHKYTGSLDQIVILLRDRTGNDFSLYKKNTVYRRIERRMSLNQIDNISQYVCYLRENPQEVDLLFKESLIGVTSFFRDPEIWAKLQTDVIPALLKEYPEGNSLRAWVPGCSTGEEAYSLAIVFKELIKAIQPKKRFTLKIFATDLDEDAINIARQGFYQSHIEADVSSPLLKTYFSRDGTGYRINKDIREMVIFAPQNIIMDPPFTKIDILTCRNLLIYFGQELQKKLIPLFHYSLNPHGVLMLGNAETIGSYHHLFSPIDKKSHLYKRIDKAIMVTDIDLPRRVFPLISSVESEPHKNWELSMPITNLKALADKLLLQNFAPAAVLTNSEGDILYISGRTGKYLEPAAGKANWNIYAMAREGLANELDRAIKKAQEQSDPVSIKDITVETSNSNQTINLIVQAIRDPEGLEGSLIIVFQDIEKAPKTTRKKPASDQQMLVRELEQAKEQLKSMRENMHSSQEELKAANEELQSTNEELQSTNEELTTSKEEMQSLNEELQTLNAELQSKVEDLSWVNNDMANLLNSTEIATIFLDNKLKIRRFTNHINQLFKLILGDVGRPLTDIVTDLDYETLEHDAKRVLETLIFLEKQIVTKDGRWFKVRIMPYRTQENVIDGVVITFIDISNFKTLEDQLRKVKNPDG